ncbi:TraT complement resistance protein [Colwellia chukchiensis]|uniref:TraT complement resistance protein n=1 Tax=Colwellia chukchiensis TaxID=641665 RepID=A0A1H7PEQ5_9GAMM|nr:complement resistance protein TraT [Colwellia chukchiensis]SEL34243.1 TraT complement resistance protein [Colwellia chukchiensis]
MKTWNKFIKITFVGLLITTLASCSAIHTSVAKRNLDVQTKVSTAIFVDPVPAEQRKIYLEVRSAVMEFDRNSFRKALSHQLVNSGNGYTLTDNPDNAQYRMSVFVRNLEKTTPEAASSALSAGFQGVAIGAAASAATGGSYRGAAATGLAVGLASTVANAFVQDVVYLLVADIQIKERAKQGVIVRRDSKINSKISDDGATTQTYSEATNLKEYRTRVVTTANKANLELAEAQSLMFDKTAYAMSAFF